MINFDENKDTSVLWSKMSERERLAFLTGFICGEGSFTINNAEYCGPIIAVANTARTCLELLALQFGGDVRERPRYNNWKQSYAWYVTGRKVADVIKAIEPFLFMKRQQAKVQLLIIETLSKTSKLPVSPENRELRYELADTLRLLNKKGDDNVRI